jgi:hypothetical protein
MGEATVIVEFEDEQGNETWRTFLIDIGPDDTRESIRQRVNEAVEDYENAETPQSPGAGGLTPVIDDFGNLNFDVIATTIAF